MKKPPKTVSWGTKSTPKNPKLTDLEAAPNGVTDTTLPEKQSQTQGWFIKFLRKSSAFGVIGNFIHIVLACIPLLIGYTISFLILPEIISLRILFGLTLISGSILCYFWLKWVETKTDIKAITPLLPIPVPLMWFLPVFFAWGFWDFSGGIYREFVPEPLPAHGENLAHQENYKACKDGDYEKCVKVGHAYYHGNDLEQNFKKSTLFYQFACNHGALSGCHNLAENYENDEGVFMADEDRAYAMFKKNCEEGYAKSCNEYGFRIEEKLIISEDETEAYYYKKACDLGNATACSNYGIAIKSTDTDAAIEAYEKACDLKKGRGCNSAGLYYDNDKNADYDETLAYAFYERACDYDYAWGCTNLGTKLRLGEGVDKNLSDALSYYLKACDMENGFACNRAGLAYTNGKGTEENLNLGNAFYRRSCNMDYAWGCYNLGTSYRDGDGLKKDMDNAIELFAIACDAGNGDACNQLGNSYFNQASNGSIKINAANKAYEKACNLEYFWGCSNLAKSYRDGKGFTQNLTTSEELFQKACNGEIAKACQYLGTLYEDGTYFEVDTKKYQHYQSKACDLGLKDACL